MKRMLKALMLSAAAFSSTSALAADLPAKIPVPATAPYTANPFDGFYVGGHIGYGWVNGLTTAEAGGGLLVENFKTAPQGFVGGGHIGWGTRFGGYFYGGIEGDFDIASLDGTATNPGFVGEVNAKDRYLASIRGRLGWIPVNHAMIYLTGGYGWGSSEFTVNVRNPVLGQVISASATQSGAVAGGGIEVPFSPNWLGRVQYLHYWLDDINSSTASPIPPVAFKAGNGVDTVTIGASYKF